jgi:membrane fusion protein (multidrug efflux system)
VAQADQAQVEAMLQYTQITPPYDALVTHRYLHTGALTSARTSEPSMIFTVVRTDRLRVMVDIPEKFARYLDVKDPGKHQVEVTLDAFPGKTFTWPIARFAPVLGPGKKVRAEMEVENTGDQFYPGMYGNARVVLEKRPGALLVPAACVNRDAGGTFVYAVAEGKAKRMAVEIGFNDGKRIEITRGLAGKEAIISTGANAVQDGQAVQAVGNK